MSLAIFAKLVVNGKVRSISLSSVFPAGVNGKVRSISLSSVFPAGVNGKVRSISLSSVFTAGVSGARIEDVMRIWGDLKGSDFFDHLKIDSFLARSETSADVNDSSELSFRPAGLRLQFKSLRV